MNIRGVLAATLFAVLLGSNGLQAQTKKKPQPPTQVCIGTKCVTSGEVPPEAAGALKFHPGFYGYFNYAGGATLARLNNGDAGLISSMKPNDNMTGIAIAIMWTTIDTGADAPNYDWSVIDAYLKVAKAVGKRLWVRVQDARITKGNSVANGEYVVPHWLIKKYGAENVMVDYAPAPRGSVAKRYSQVVTDAYIAMFQAMAARYDSDPYFEGVTFFEETAFQVETGGSSVTVQTPGADYSANEMFTQLYRLMAGLRDPQRGFKFTNVMLSANYLFKNSDTAAAWTDVLSHIQRYRMVLGGPDSWIPSWTYPNVPMDGPQHAGPGNHGTNPEYRRALYSDEVYRGWWPGTTDWRDKILFGPDVEITDIGGYITHNMGDAIPTLAQIWQVRGNLDRSQYFFFDINYKGTGNYGGPAQQWWTGEYPWVQQAGATNTHSPYQ